jgi:hypothetical protein
LRVGVATLADLPTSQFIVTGVFLNAAKGVHDDDLVQLTPLRRLMHLHLGNPAFTNAALLHVRSLSELQTLQTDGSQITERGLETVAELPLLYAVTGQSPPFVDNGLKSLDALPHLESLRLSGLSVRETAALAGLRTLDRLRDLTLLTNGDVSDDVVRRLQEGRPRLRVIINAETRGTDPVSALVERLRLRGAVILVMLINNTVQSIDSRSTLPERPFHVRNIRFLPGSRPADSDLRGLDQFVELGGLVVFGAAVTDAGVAELANCRRLVNLNFVRTSMTDAAADHLAHLTALHALEVRDTRMTAAGVERLHAALPDTNIRSDFGDFAPAWASP